MLLPLLLLAGAADDEREDEDDFALDCCLVSDLGAEDLGEADVEDLLGAEEDLASLLLDCEGADDLVSTLLLCAGDEDPDTELLGSADVEGLAEELLDSVEAGLVEELLVSEEDDLTAGVFPSDAGLVELLVVVEGRVAVLLPWLDPVVERLVPTVVLPVDLLAVPASLPVVVRVVVLPEVASVLLDDVDLSAVEEAPLRELLVPVLRFELLLERVSVYILSPSLLVSGLE